MVNSDRLRRTFLDLVSLNSPPGEEREVARLCVETLRDAGFVCQIDAAGNVIAQKGGTLPAAPRIFFSAHMDTVQPTAGLEVREVDGVFHTAGTTILGADDKAALAAILEAVRTLEERRLPRGDLQVIFSTREEIGLVGAKALAPEVIAGSLGFVFDTGGPTGAVVTAAPTHYTLEVRIGGRPAHAGMAPEKGISALQIAARAIDRMSLGRIDAETVANVGTLRGGVANNVVAADACITLETRSLAREKVEGQLAHMRACLEEAAAHFGGAVEIAVSLEYEGYRWEPDALPVRLAAEAWRRLGREPVLRPTGGGADASVFNARGIPSVVLSCGYLDAHTTEERVSLADMAAAAEWAVEIARAAAGAPAA